jgi:LuxR family maltose regulon positive regulatory protein
LVDEGEPLQGLLALWHAARLEQAGEATAADREARSGYVGKLLAAFAPSGAGAGGAPQAAVSPLVEPLSERELEVLRLVAAGLTNQAIADQLFIALSTVKSHTNSIYGKLGVRNRTQAVAQARALSLLQGPPAP